MITFYTATGQTLYVRFNDVSDTAVDLTEGSSLEVGEYVATDAVIVTAGLASGTYSGRVFVGTASGQANTDVQVGIVEQFIFNGTIETATSTDVAAIRAVTDLFQFTATNFVQADMNYVNSVLLTGAGVVGDLWEP